MVILCGQHKAVICKHYMAEIFTHSIVVFSLALDGSGWHGIVLCMYSFIVICGQYMIMCINTTPFKEHLCKFLLFAGP